MLSRLVSRRAVVRLFALSAVAIGSLVHTSSSRADETAVANFLKSRIWWADVGTFSNKPFGFLYLFGSQQHAVADGWFVGHRAKFTGFSTPTTILGFAWKPTSDGVIIDHGSSVERIRITGVYPEYEAITLTGGVSSIWTTTRSPYSPESIRRNYWW